MTGVPATRRRSRRWWLARAALAFLLLWVVFWNVQPNASRSQRIEFIERLLDDYAYDRAEEAARGFLSDTEAAHGPDSPEAAEALDLLLRCLELSPKGRDPESRHLAERAVGLKRKLYGPADARVATSLALMAGLLEEAGSTAEATALFEEALGIAEDAPHPDPVQIATILNGYGVLLARTGEYSRAVHNLERAQALLAAAPEPEELLVGLVQNHLGNVRYETGDYVQARSCWENALEIRKRHYGENHQRVAAIEHGLATLLKDMGDLRGAMELESHVLRIHEKALDDPEHLYIGFYKLTLASLSLEMGDLGGAKALYDAALHILKLRVGEEHELVAKCLHGLGRTFHAQGDYETAVQYYEKALAIREKLLPERHYLIGYTLRSMAGANGALGRMEMALLQSERTLAIYEETLGDEHPEVAQVLALLALLHLEGGDTAAAIARALRADAIGAAHARLAAGGVSEREALLYAGARARGLDLALEVLERGRANLETTTRVWDAIVRSRALVLDEMTARSRSLALARNPEIAPLVADFKQASTRLANLIARDPGSRSAAHGGAVQAARRDKEAAERVLARYHEFQEDPGRDAFGLAEVRAALRRGSALVAFAEYEPPLRAAPAGAHPVASVGESRRAPRMLALVVRADGEPRAVRLGSARDIDSLMALWSTEISQGAQRGKRAPAPADGDSVSYGAALRRRVWDPIQAHLGEARRVFVVPEGTLHRLAFTALPLDGGRFLIDAGWRFHYLAAERDLVPARDSSAEGEGFVAFGGIDFDAAQEPRHAAAGALPHPVENWETRGPQLPCAALQDFTFTPLPATGREARDVAEAWVRPAAAVSGREASPAVQVFTGEQATESAFKAVASGKSVLHLATHGFFLGACSATPADTRGIHPFLPEGAALRPSENPLRLSGLAFAGANHRHEAGLDEEDGVLTAQEVASLDLQGVQWAVLSACNTGAGEVQVGEGVLGLRRAFQVAGVRSVIMSLWAVSDEATREWMAALYEARLLRGLGTADAVHEASAQVLKARRLQGRSTHPFFWSGFVGAGDWR